MLDGTPTLNESDSPKKRKKKAGEMEVPLIEIQDTFTLDLHFRVLQNIDGVYLTEEVCKIELLDTLVENEKSSVFWLSYYNQWGELV